MAAKKIKNGTTWGAWRLSTDTMHLVLTWKGNPERYSIPLIEITSSARMLDWIFQLRTKAWMTNEVVGDLLMALDDLLDPQATLCSGGEDKPLDAARHLKLLLD